MRLFVLILLLFPAVASAWSEADTERQVAYTALHAIDWGQTLDISDRCESTATTKTAPKTIPGRDPVQSTEIEPGETSELNPFLSDCPSRGEVNRYFLLSGLAHYAASRMLPANYRKWWQRATITLEAGVVAHNVKMGINVRF